MSESGARCRVCLLYDAENIGGGAARAREVLKALNAVGLDVVSAATTYHWQTRDSLASVLPLDPVALSGSTPAGKDYEDILLATASGYFLCRALTENESIQGIVLASEDKLVSMCLLPWLRRQFPTYIVGLRPFVINQTLESLGVKKIVFGDYARKAKVSFDPVFSHDRYAFEFSDESLPRYPGLRVLKVPVSREPVPRFIPFPTTVEELTIGSGTSCDLPLEYWTSRLGQIYTPHAFFGCTTSGWHISSAKGMRKNTKAVRVNERFIDASGGNVPIKGGDRITIATFEFELFLPRREHLGNTVDMAKDFEIIAHIEQRLHVLVGRELSSTSETWWTDKIPKDVREECEARARDERDEEHPFRFTDLSHLNKVLIANWDTLRLGGLDKIWRSKTHVRSAFASLIRSRNLTMHPTRGGADENDRVFLERLCSALASKNNNNTTLDNY